MTTAQALPWNRRRFVQSAALMAVPALAPAAGAATVPNLEAFASSPSVLAGGTIDFYARDPGAAPTASARVPFMVTRLGWPDVDVHKGSVGVGFRAVPADASSNGCRGWGVAYRLKVPAAWRSGLYWATFGTGDSACCVPFVVRRSPGTAQAAKVMVQIPVATPQAYNNYGGKSLYEFNSTQGVRATAVSFSRPDAEPFNFAFDRWQPSFIRWLEKNGVVADFCTSLDLHAESGLLRGYQLFTTAGHDEYWSRAMRDRLDAFVDAGGHAAIFSGNTCWWQMRLEGTPATGRRMVCFKSRTADTGGTPATKTTNWQDLRPPYPETSTIGLSFANGATWTTDLPRPLSPFVVQQPGHWAFAGTGLVKGARFGAAWVGYETDAVATQAAGDDRLYPAGTDGTPTTLRLLAHADCSDWDARAQALGLGGERSGYASIAVFSRGGPAGTVFSVGSTDWVLGLQAELDGQSPNEIGKITANVFRRLSAAWQEPVEVWQWHAAVSGNPWSHAYVPAGPGPAGMVLDGQVFRALAAPVAGSVPVYGARSLSASAVGWRYGLTLSASLPASTGFAVTGVAFHAFAAPQAGTAPVYQLRGKDQRGQVLLKYSLSGQATAAWRVDGIVFHVPAAA